MNAISPELQQLFNVPDVGARPAGQGPGIGPGIEPIGPPVDYRSFQQYAEKAVDKVNAYQVQADNKVEAFLQGEDVPIHDVMVELGKAETSMRLMTTVMQKVIQAYNDIARIQV